MDFTPRILEAQKYLKEQELDGWLLYDFRRNNDLAHAYLRLSPELLFTRRFFYWVPKNGAPVKIVHAVENNVLDQLPGEKITYLKWEMLESAVKGVLKDSKRIAMEYSPHNHVPYVSKVDGGTLDFVRSCGVEVISSAPFLQYFTASWDDYQLETHLAAAEVLDRTAGEIWERISDGLKKGEVFTEFDVQQWILEALEENDCMMAGSPICGVNGNIANPHYVPRKGHSSQVKKDDFILIDLWCKKKQARSVYADISRVAVASDKPSPNQQKVFNVVRKAQKEATDFVQKRIELGQVVKGYEVDKVSRKVVEDAGYGEFFTHRTGHSINVDDHGSGANIDSLETLEERPLIPRTCFSIEPGIYLPGEFGIRLEYDVFITEHREIMITGGIQDSIVTLL